MKLTEVQELNNGATLVTTDGVTVKFVKLTVAAKEPDAEYRPGNPVNLAEVKLPNGTTTVIPPRSLHLPPTSRPRRATQETS